MTPNGPAYAPEHLRDVRVVASEPSLAERLEAGILVRIVVLDAVAVELVLLMFPVIFEITHDALQHPADR